MLFWDCLQKAAVLLRLDQGKQRFQHAPALADQADVSRKTQPDARRINVDLDALGLARLGVELHVREAAAGDDQRIALLHRVLRGGRAEQAYPPRGERAVVGDHPLAEQGLDDRAANFFRQFQDLLAGVRHPRPARMATLLPALIRSAACPKTALAGSGDAAVNRSALCLAMLALERGTSEVVHSWMSLGMVKWATVRRERAALMASSTTLWTCAGPMIRSL